MDGGYLIMYLRLSKEDLIRKDESNSITNQRRIQERFIAGREDLRRLKVLELVDDGFSGTNFDRPGMKRLLELAKSGKVSCVLVKDLSRFGREYIEVGTFLEHIFPALHIRFIAINDTFDSDDYKEDVPGIDIALKNIMNYYSSQEQSKKVRDSIYAQRETGEHVGAWAPYGYRKQPGHGNRLFVDEEAADVVRRIFRLTLEGKGRAEIARILNVEGILTPGDYKRSKKNGKTGNKADNRTAYEQNNKQSRERSGIRRTDWSAAAIVNILKNEAYIGTAVSGQHFRPVIGNKHVERTPREKWTIIEHAHEPIISKEEFDKVSESFLRPVHPIGPPREKLSGKLSCGHCGRAMTLRKKKGGMYCYCQYYRQNPDSACVKEQYSLEDLENIVYSVTMAHIKAFADRRKLARQAAADRKSLERRRKSKRATEQELRQQRKQLYEKFKDRKISLEEYKKQKADINESLRQLSEEETEPDASVGRKPDIEAENVISRYIDAGELTREMANELIQRIYIYNKERIWIEFKYRDLFEE